MLGESNSSSEVVEIVIEPKHLIQLLLSQINLGLTEVGLLEVFELSQEPVPRE